MSAVVFLEFLGSACQNGHWPYIFHASTPAHMIFLTCEAGAKSVGVRKPKVGETCGCSLPDRSEFLFIAPVAIFHFDACSCSTTFKSETSNHDSFSACNPAGKHMICELLRQGQKKKTGSNVQVVTQLDKSPSHVSMPFACLDTLDTPGVAGHPGYLKL